MSNDEILKAIKEQYRKYLLVDDVPTPEDIFDAIIPVIGTAKEEARSAGFEELVESVDEFFQNEWMTCDDEFAVYRRADIDKFVKDLKS